MSIPDGFEPLETQSPYILLVGPMYLRRDANGPVFGLQVEDKHCNSRGRLHGGMMSVFADIGIGNNVGHALVAKVDDVDALPRNPIATVNITLDFFGSASAGDWVEMVVEVMQTGRSLAFANATLTVDEKRIARANAVFKIFS